MERKYAVVELVNKNHFSDIKCVCDSITDADIRCHDYQWQNPNRYYAVWPTFSVEEGESCEP